MFSTSLLSKNKISISKSFFLLLFSFSLFPKITIASDIEERLRIVTPEGEEQAICEANFIRNKNLCWAKFHKGEGKLDLAFRYYDKAIKINRLYHNSRGSHYIWKTNRMNKVV